MKVKYYLKEMRIHHYIKNLLVFAPVVCSGNILNPGKLMPSVFAFISFCLMSSAVYFINDIKDVEKDRLHPTKCKRPIASGNISIKSAVAFTVILILAAVGMMILCRSLYSLIFLLVYFIINLAYSFGLKNIPLLDVAILVSGFLIRVICGSVATDIYISNWLYLVIISGAFYLGFGKRRNEYRDLRDDETREVIKKYSFNFLDKIMYVCMALIFVFYALWAVDERTVSAYHSSGLIWTVPLVMLIFMKYSMAVESDSDGDPVEVLVHDKVLLGLCTIYGIIMLLLLYVF